MALLKYAKAEILAKADRLENLDDGLPQSQRLGKTRLASLREAVASAQDPSLLDPEKFMYLRVRAVSAGEWWGPNDNGDNFDNGELSQRYATFVYTPAYLDHDNLDADRAVGIQIAAVYHPGPQPGGWVEIIKAVDRERASKVRVSHLAGQPDLLTAIRRGEITDTSMGCFVEYSLCSICGNRAEEESDYCAHIANHKGQMVRDAEGKERFSYEDNHGITFFEDSIITSRLDQGGGGADLNAKILSEVADAQMQRAASRGGHHWTSLVVDRLSLCQESAMTKKQTAAKQTAAEVNGPDAVSYFSAVAPEGKVTQVDTGNYPGKSQDNKDAALLEQSKGTSKQSSPPTIIDDPGNKLSQQTDESDYPLKEGPQPEPSESPDNMDKALAKQKRRAQDADPANKLGETPEEVLEAEQELEKEQAGAVAPAQDEERVENTEDKMEERHERERAETEQDEAKQEAPTLGQRLRSAWAALTETHANNVPDGEGVRILQDHIGILKANIKTVESQKRKVVSSTARRTLNQRKARLEAQLNKAFAVAGKASFDPRYAARLNQYAEKMGGNPQSMVDFDDIYEQGASGPDAATWQQSQGKSPKEPAPAVGRGSNVSQEESADDHPVPKDGGKLAFRKTKGKLVLVSEHKGKVRVIAEGDEAGKVLDEIQDYMEDGMPYDQAEAKAFNQAAKRAASKPERRSAKHPPKLSGRRAALLQRIQAQDDEDEPENAEQEERMGSRRRQARPEPYNLGKSEDPRGSGSTDPEAKIQGGNADTLTSPSTEEAVGSGAEYIRTKDGPSNRPIQPVEGRGRRRRAAEDVEERLDNGNHDTLESPSTSEVEDDGDEANAGKLDMETQDTSVEAKDYKLSARDLLIQRQAQKIKWLQEANRHFARNARRVAAKELVKEMASKGLFARAGNPVRRRQAMDQEFMRLCKLSASRFAEAKRNVAAMPTGPRVREHVRKVQIGSREGAVTNPVNQAVRQDSSDEAVLSTMFES